VIGIFSANVANHLSFYLEVAIPLEIFCIFSKLAFV